MSQLLCSSHVTTVSMTTALSWTTGGDVCVTGGCMLCRKLVVLLSEKVENILLFKYYRRTKTSGAVPCSDSRSGEFLFDCFLIRVWSCVWLAALSSVQSSPLSPFTLPLSNPSLTVLTTLLLVRSTRWSQGRLTRHTRVASSSSCSAALPTTPFTLHVSSWLPQDTILSASTPTFTETAKSAWASWGRSRFTSVRLVVGRPPSHQVESSAFLFVCCCRTWTGPAWSPAQSISSVLISIQSLMTENPYHNEPGFEQVRVWP